MTITTKSVKTMPVSKNLANRIILNLELEKRFDSLAVELQKVIYMQEFTGLNNEEYYYVQEDELIIPNPQTVPMNPDGFTDMPGDLEWLKMSRSVAEKWFQKRRSKNPIIKGTTITYIDKSNCTHTVSYVYCADIKQHIRINDGYTYSWSEADGDGIKIPIYKLSESEKWNVLRFLVEQEWNPFENEILKKDFYFFTQLKRVGMFGEPGARNLFQITSDDEYQFVCAKLKELGQEFKPENSEESEKLKSGVLLENEELIELLKKDLLDCDKKRANMESYPEHILQDPESGHWDLWDDETAEMFMNTEEALVARNPVADALENRSGVVGIDFGTKSTVVTYRQSRADVLPMRIGSGQFSRAVTKNDYENPTVMELRNVEAFLEKYRQHEGRPNTCWEDLLISHEAAEQLKSEQSKGDTFATFFSELKQWASDKSRQVRLRDLRGNEINIPSYLSLTEEDFDPIEIYAYYIGLFINNMVHKIYLRYKLSFPATVEKKVRDKILESFTRGIKKSLPVQVLKDEQCMKIFKVEQGASEPAAYAITALYGYGFDPEGDDKHCYAIFDFGGGTTDFDFGIWSSEEEEPENYDYKISHFGQGGDPYLGGENLLQILAYHVFIKNYDRLLKDKIVFIRPSGEREIAGKDYLVCQDSQYAHFNQKRMMEKLRGVWEGKTEEREQLMSGSIALSLFTMDGETKNNYSLEVDLEELDELLESRIEKGVSQFFEAFKNCFVGEKSVAKNVQQADEINIFLAGNSSKSPMVYKIFKKYIDTFENGLKAREDVEKREWFKLYPPLGTPISDEILKGTLKPSVDDILEYLNKTENSNLSVDKEDVSDLNKPTGKTGVAYGLLNNRVRVVQNETEEIGFRYYIGQNRKNKFYCVIDKDTQKYDVWVKFCTASREDFDIWFTRSAEAMTKKMPIDQIGVYSEIGFVSEPCTDKFVFIRLVSPTEIEYVIAGEEEIENDSYDKNLIEKVFLQEKQ